MLPANPPVPNASDSFPARRFPKAAIACEPCRKSKVKCDQNHPCRRCDRKSLTCSYREISLAPARASREARPLRPTTNKAEGATSHRHLQRLSGYGGGRNLTSPSGCHRHDMPSADCGCANHAASGSELSTLGRAKDADVLESSGDLASPHTADAAEQSSPNSTTFIGVNNFTKGIEFYGPTAELAFLFELRSLARACSTATSPQTGRDGVGNGGTRSPFTADELYPDDTPYKEDDSALRSAKTRTMFPARASEAHTAPDTPTQLLLRLEFEKECIQLYFANLHVIYTFLDKATFWERCRNEIREPRQLRGRLPVTSRTSRFPALYSAILAVGALTAGDDAGIVQEEECVRRFLADQIAHSRNQSRPPKHSRPSFMLAHFFYASAKTLLGDIFESSSLETSQTLLLMSIFNHYSLKPHAAYMYSAVAARTAFAMGSTYENDLSKNSLAAIKTWWFLYCHEMEVCCSLGRETFLREPAHYPVFVSEWKDPLPPQFSSKDDPNVFFGRAMTALALITRRTSESIYNSTSAMSPELKSETAMSLDAQLLDWRRQLAPMFDLDSATLKEPETVTKRKIMLRLRFHTSRILIHRSFLIDAVCQRGEPTAQHIQLCVDAADKTIQLVYEALMNRPFFRTWFYNIMYTFQATMITLYVLISRLDEREQLYANVQTSLTIFEAMDISSVAQKCAKRTRGIFETIKSRRSPTTTALRPTQTDATDIAATPKSWGDFTSEQLVEDDVLASLIDPDVLEMFGSEVDMLGSDIGSLNHSDMFWGANLS